MLETAYYRRDYKGEVINDSHRSQRILVKPKNLFHRDGGKAIVLGNGRSRLNNDLEIMLKSNKTRHIIGYKVVYACNGAAWDSDADYYVINNRVLMGHLDKRLWNQLFVPWDMFIDYDGTNMIPLVGPMDAGSIAAFLACFDGNNEVFLFGFDRQELPNDNNNCYAGKPCYDPANTTVDSSSWDLNLYGVMKAYPDVKFYRVGSGRSPKNLVDLHNFKDVSYKESVFLGDF